MPSRRKLRNRRPGSASDEIPSAIHRTCYNAPGCRPYRTPPQRPAFAPVDFGTRGTCQIGGTIATNAGGHAVIRHGMTRDRALGLLEVVLADGRILDLMNTKIKNNTGCDL